MIPKSVILMGFRIKVMECPGLIATDDVYGDFDLDKMLIRVDSDLNDQLKWATYFHECIEAANILCEMELPHNKIEILGNFFQQIYSQLTPLRVCLEHGLQGTIKRDPKT